MNQPGLIFHAVGDIALGDHPLRAGFGTHSRCRREAADFPWRQVAARLGAADLLFGNLECTLSEAGLKPGRYESVQMRGQPAYLQGLVDCGFDVLNVANNHSMQHGKTAFRETVEMLESQGIAPVGIAAEPYRNGKPVIVEREGVTVGFLGYSQRPRQYFTEEPLYAEGREAEILEEVRSAKGECDVLVVSMHWGDEFIDRPSPSEITLGHRIIDAGAHLVVGHHPHVLRGLEHYKHGYIAYSLGNFVCDMHWGERLRETAILECIFVTNGILSAKLLPAVINDDCQPWLVEGALADQVTARVGRLSAQLDERSELMMLEPAEAYGVDADLAHRAERSQAHRFFARNVHRFPLALVVQQLRTFVRNRLTERGLLRKTVVLPD